MAGGLDTDGLVLLRGGHESPADGVCLMEWVAYLAGEPHSDHPECACPIITSLAIRLNDRWSDEDRQLLKPFAVKIIGTRGTADDERARRWVMFDWVVRTLTPAMLDLAGLEEEAGALRALVEIRDKETASASRELVQKARRAALRVRSKYDAADAAYAAAYAADAAYAAAYAAAAADAAYAAAYAAAAAAAAAAYAAYAADAAAAASRRVVVLVRDLSLELLERLILTRDETW
jgi:hypothetical protein